LRSQASGRARHFTPQQGDYLELLIEVLAKNGTAEVADLYESPFTLRARGPEDLFTDAQIDAIEAVLQDAVVIPNTNPTPRWRPARSSWPGGPSPIATC